jgi:hypothetical protein
VTNPARHGPEFSTGIAFNIRSLLRCVMPFCFTRSYSERCVRRRVFRKENEPAGAILIGNALSHAARSQDLALQKHLASGRPQMCDFSTKEVFHRNSGGRLLEKKNPGFIPRATQQVFPLCQPASPLSRQLELRLQRDLSFRSPRAAGSWELDLWQE